MKYYYFNQIGITSIRFFTFVKCIMYIFLDFIAYILIIDIIEDFFYILH